MSLLNRYQTGSLVTLFSFVIIVAMFGLSCFDALHSHDKADWIFAANALLLLFIFDRALKNKP